MRGKLVEDLKKLICGLCDDDNLEFYYTCCIEEEIVKVLNANGIDIRDVNFMERKIEFLNGKIQSYWMSGERNLCGCGSNVFHLENDECNTYGACNSCKLNIYLYDEQCKLNIYLYDEKIEFKIEFDDWK